MFLLFLLPTLISFMKPKPLPPSDRKGKGKPPILSNSSKNSNKFTVQQPQPEPQPLQKGKKPKPTRAHLGKEIGFDLLLTRLSLVIDIISQTLIILFSSPAVIINSLSLTQTATGQTSFAQRQAMFVAASALGSMGSGVVPAVHSLALCMLQVRSLDVAASNDGADAIMVELKEEGTGPLFGAFAVLQTIGQTILGPMIFGLIYSGTVAKFPAAIFTVATALLVCSLMVILCVRNPVRPAYPGRSKGKKNRHVRDVERGRSRVSKDLRGGAIVNYGSYGSPNPS